MPSNCFRKIDVLVPKNFTGYTNLISILEIDLSLCFFKFLMIKKLFSVKLLLLFF